jgi:rare lipoprotein A
MTKALALIFIVLMAAPAVAGTSDIYKSKTRIHFTQALFHIIPKKVKKKRKPKSNLVSKVLNFKHGFFNTLYQTGQASWYGSPDWMKIRDGFNHGPMAGGGRFDTTKPYCAHLYLKFGTRILIKNLQNGKTALCTIRDRGPYNSRILDVSYLVKTELNMGGTGLIAIYVR